MRGGVLRCFFVRNNAAPHNTISAVSNSAIFSVPTCTGVLAVEDALLFGLFAAELLVAIELELITEDGVLLWLLELVGTLEEVAALVRTKIPLKVA